MERRCETCTFFYALKNSCRRNPPKVEPIAAPTPIPGRMQVQWVGAWPNVEPSDWCGEYQPNEETRSKAGEALAQALRVP